MDNKPKLRDSSVRVLREPYPLNNIPDNVIQSIGGHFVYLISIGRSAILGSDWGDALASAVKGATHLDAPLGIVDVATSRMGWSTKTVQVHSTKLFSTKKVRLISGRCSPNYSYGINDPFADIQKTGNAVLNIWNERVNIAYEKYTPVRTSVLMRSSDLLSYMLFEEETHRVKTSDYVWKPNKSGNFNGFLKSSKRHCFTWQPHGAQFTILVDVPESVKKFTIKKPPLTTKTEKLRSINFDPSWVTIHK